MASKAYVASMTVTELKQELKQRGLSTRGSKKSLRDRLERVRAIFFTPLSPMPCSQTRTAYPVISAYFTVTYFTDY